jgi:hypothetical protein
LILSAASAFGNFAELVRQGDEYDAQFKAEAALQYYLPAEKLKPDDAVLLVKIARQHVYRMTELSVEGGSVEVRTHGARVRRACGEAGSERVRLASRAGDLPVGKLTPLMSNKEGIEASRRIKSAAETAVKLNPRNDYAWHLLGRWHQELEPRSAVSLVRWP